MSLKAYWLAAREGLPSENCRARGPVNSDILQKKTQPVWPIARAKHCESTEAACRELERDYMGSMGNTLLR